jgi:gliding motility-associated-like protein
MKYSLLLSLLVFNCFYAQNTAFKNFGNLKMHENATIGFHTDLINDGNFNSNLGEAGFYNENQSLSISGTAIPGFFDMVVDVKDHLFLDINTEVFNSVSYIRGHVITPRDSPNISLDYQEDSFFVLENDLKHTDGYASYSGELTFNFPIGDADKLRPLITTNTVPNTVVKAAYFKEDPNLPSTFNAAFRTNALAEALGAVSENEFWDFDGPEASTITLTWDPESEIDRLVENLNQLRVVGWHKTEQQWQDLGNTGLSGDLLEGRINSIAFNPDNYEIVTFGALVRAEDLVVYNLVSPNGNGENDTFTIEGIEAFNNRLTIYNRWGNKVFEIENYKNTWEGTSNSNRVVKREARVPAGTYYYALELTDSGRSIAGWLYVNY